MNRIPWLRPRIREVKARLSLARIVPDATPKVQPMYHNFVGIDIAAATFTAAWQQATFEQRDADYQRLSQMLQRVASPEQTLVVLEATGTYWLGLAWWLHEAGFVVSVINPAQANLFARLELQQTKTDAIDAQLLATFGRQRRPALWTPPPAIYDQLQQRLSQREALLAIKTQETNRLHALHQHPHAEPMVLDRLERHIAFLEAEIDALNAELADLLTGPHEWALAAQRLLTIPGVGLITAAWILTATHCFAHCDRPEQVAAFAGLVPHRRESGTSRRGYRPLGRTGHAALRQALFMAAASAARFNPCIRPFYERLVARGKPKKLARAAAARKLLHIAWAVVVNECDFDPRFAPQPEQMSAGA